MMRGEDPNSTISGPSSAFRWRADEYWLVSFVIFRGSGTCTIAKKPYIFMIFQGGGAPAPSESAHVDCCSLSLILPILVCFDK